MSKPPAGQRDNSDRITGVARGIARNLNALGEFAKDPNELHQMVMLWLRPSGYWNPCQKKEQKK